MQASRAFEIAGGIVLVGGIALAWYLSISRFRFGDGVVAELKASPEKMVAVLRDFITVFAILLAFQSAAFIGVVSMRGGWLSQGMVYLGLFSGLVFLVGLFWTLTAIAVGSIGGVPLHPWHFSALMMLLTIGVALTLFLLGQVTRAASDVD